MSPATAAPFSLRGLILFLLLIDVLSVLTRAAPTATWKLLLTNIGISAMHMQLLHNDRVVIFDRTDFGKSNISLPGGKCRHDARDTALKVDCTAHSVEYDVAKNAVRPLMVLTDVWCSSGAVSPDGRLMQTGGYNDGDHTVRIYNPCDDNSCEWEEIQGGLAQKRWYATNHILPDGREIIIGGRAQFNYEFFPKTSPREGSFYFPFLKETNDPKIENNLYPFVFLNHDGNLFIFANNRAILFDYKTSRVVRNYPEIPGGDPRTYPSTGSAVVLPILDGDAAGIEVLVCGGAPKGSFLMAKKGQFVDALDTCGRIGVNVKNPQWSMEKMPLRRTMGDMVLLPNGDVLIINGGSKGTAGWELGRDPVLNPVIYKPTNPAGSRFEVQTGSSTPRMYHSTAVLLRDGRVLVSGSNPHLLYRFTGVNFPTDLSLQSFSPPYLSPEFADLRPIIVAPPPPYHLTAGHNQLLNIQFTIAPQKLNTKGLTVAFYAPPFNTHSFSMNQRLVVVNPLDVAQVGKFTFQMRIKTPGSRSYAPSGFYILYLVHERIPSEGMWIQLR